jgi:hypothetical protein
VKDFPSFVGIPTPCNVALCILHAHLFPVSLRFACFMDMKIIPSQIQCLGGARKHLASATSEEFGSGHCGGTLVLARAS